MPQAAFLRAEFGLTPAEARLSWAAMRPRGGAAGCDAYVTKPYSPRQLLARIREFLR
jgi:CheY-like chemotaxis protein